MSKQVVTEGKGSIATHCKRPKLVCFMNHWNKTNKQASGI
jgi:hypothetical protein